MSKKVNKYDYVLENNEKIFNEHVVSLEKSIYLYNILAAVKPDKTDCSCNAVNNYHASFCKQYVDFISSL